MCVKWFKLWVDFSLQLGLWDIILWTLFPHLFFLQQSCQVNFTADDYQIVFNNRKRQASELHNDSEFCLTSALYIHPIAKFAKHRQRPNIVGLNCFVSQSLSSKVVLSPSRRVQTVPCLSCRSNCDLLAWPWVPNDCAPHPHLTPSKSHLIQISIIFLYLFVIFGGICKI